MKTLSKPVLVLNKSWSPVGTVSLQRAIVMLFSTYPDGEPKARIIEHPSYQTFTWEDWSRLRPSVTDEQIRAANISFRVPEIILLTRYDKLPEPKVHFSRRTLYKRDNMTCQYCGCKPGTHELTIDHIMPVSRGGKTTWENCVMACIKCNSKKADRTPEEAGMKLLSKPKKPRANMYRFENTRRCKSWDGFVSECYWLVSIEDEQPE